MAPNTPIKDRVQKARQKMRDAGFKLIQIWVHPEDEKQLKDYADYLKDRRK